MRRSRSFDLLDLISHPLLERAFELRLIILGFKVLNRFPCFIQRNVMTRNGFRAMFLLDKIQQVTLATRMRAIWIAIVNAGQGVLEG